MRVRNWEKWQSYRKDRGQPPWIKLHRALLRDPNWVALSDAQRGQLASLWMLAADRGGEIPDDPEIIRKLCQLDTAPDLEMLIQRGFLELDASLASSWRQGDANVTNQSREEAEAESEAKEKQSKSRPETERETESKAKAEAEGPDLIW